MSAGEKSTTSSIDGGINTDGKGIYEPNSKYPDNILTQIYIELALLVAALIVVVGIIFLNWSGCFDYLLCIQAQKVQIFKKYVFYAASGMLGGLIFSIKYFYRVVAKGFWTQDRRPWRIMSPLVSMVIAFIFGAMLDAGMTSGPKEIHTSTIIVIGFFAGYFADEAVGKMYEIASVIFGKSQLKDTKNISAK